MENTKEQKIIKFDNLKKQILNELQNRHLEKDGISEPVTLIDGFINQPFSMELSNSIVIGGPTIPMIMLLGNNTGRIYLFALKAILKNNGL